MNTWFTKNLGDAMLAGESLENVKMLFLSAYEQAENANEMALYFRHESEGHLHCEVKIYFTPASARVAKALDATPCSKPTPDSLGLLAGSEASWSVLFP
ncbi:MAG: hypothetical protein ABI144_00970 [Gallionella sp.]